MNGIHKKATKKHRNFPDTSCNIYRAISREIGQQSMHDLRSRFIFSMFNYNPLKPCEGHLRLFTFPTRF